MTLLVGWQKGNPVHEKPTVPIILILFHNNSRKENELRPANPGSSCKSSLNCSREEYEMTQFQPVKDQDTVIVAS